MSGKKRFAQHTEAERNEKKLKTHASNTLKCDKKAADILREYLKETGQEQNFESFSVEQLSAVLGNFYLDARTKGGDHYKLTSLENMRYSLNRHLKAPPVSKTFDIINGQEFVEANKSFEAAKSELKRIGKAAINHYPMINDTDLIKLYHSVFMSPNTPSGLLNRVQMNLRLYFCRRANENMESMTKSTFSIGTYENGQKYVYKSVDELTKNHRTDKELISGHMPEDPSCGDLCPVASFTRYISKLNPASDRLWQYPKDYFLEEDPIWFQNRPIGRDSLQKFMPNLSKAVPLSQKYTNHSVRVTGVSLLGRHNFSIAQIQSVSGHKSATSLALYQRVSDGEKRKMGSVISHMLKPKDIQLSIEESEVYPTHGIQPVNTSKSNQPVQNIMSAGSSSVSSTGSKARPLPAATPRPPIDEQPSTSAEPTTALAIPQTHMPLSTSPDILSCFDDEIAGVDWSDLFCEFHSEAAENVRVQRSQSVNVRTATRPVFMNCTFNININK